MFMVLGAKRRLVNAKSSVVHENNPDAACMPLGEMERRRGRRDQFTGNITPAAL